MGYGLGTCATCDGALYRGKEVGVVGGGDTAVEEATFLTRFASKVTLIHRRDALRASKVMQDRIFANPKVDYLWNSEVAEYLGDDEPYRALTGVRLRSTKDGSTRDVAVRRRLPGDRPLAQHRGLRGPARDDPRGLPADPHRPGLEGHRRPPRACSTGCPTTARPRASRGSSPPATWSTPTTARRSPPPARAAPRPSTARNGSKRRRPALSDGS